MPTIEVGVKSATKRGYEVATENDSINFTHPGSETRRGRVSKGVAQTLDCACNQGVIVKSPHFAFGIGPLRKGVEKDVVALTEQRTEEAKAIRKENLKKGVDFSPRRGKELVPRKDGVSNTITATQGKEQLLLEKTIIPTQLGNSVSRGNSAFCLRASEPNGIIEQTQNDFRIRRLTERECFRLMGVRDEDIVLVNSGTQSYKIAGNGIEVKTISSIVRQIYKPVKSKLSLF